MKKILSLLFVITLALYGALWLAAKEPDTDRANSLADDEEPFRGILSIKNPHWPPLPGRPDPNLDAHYIGNGYWIMDDLDYSYSPMWAAPPLPPDPGTNSPPTGGTNALPSSRQFNTNWFLSDSNVFFFQKVNLSNRIAAAHTNYFPGTTNRSTKAVFDIWELSRLLVEFDRLAADYATNHFNYTNNIGPTIWD